MKVKDKTKGQLEDELRSVYRRVAQPEASDAQQKQAEQALAESERMYRELVELSSDMIFTVDMKGNFLFTNKAFEKHLGYSVEEMKRLNGFELVHPEDLEAVTEQFGRLLEEKSAQAMEYRYKTKDGLYIDILNNASPILDRQGNIVALLGVARDITQRKQVEEELGKHRGRLEALVEQRTAELQMANERLQLELAQRKQAEEAMRKSEVKFRSIFEQSHDGMVLADRRGTIVDLNRAQEHIMGLKRAEVIGRPIWDVMSQVLAEEQKTPGIYEGLKGDVLELIQRGQSRRLNQLQEATIQRPDGTHRVIQETSFPIQTEEGLMFSAVLRDVTERKQAEDALRQSEERYRTVLEEMEDSYFEVDMGGHITFANDSTCQNLCIPREKLMGESYKAFSTEKDIEAVYKTFNKVYRTGKPVKSLSWEVVRGDGSVGFAEAAILPLRNKEGEIIGFRGIGRDVTERKRMEEERRELEQRAQLASRLASVGEIASGIAHEINNPLTGVIGYAQLLMQKDVPKDIKEDLKAINEGGQRVASIVNRLLTFAGRHKPQRDYTSINDIIATTFNLRAYELETNNIETNLRLDRDLPATIADVGQLQQVFLNLIINAETEMKLAHGTGKLSIKTEAIDNTIRVSFKDDGPGIAKENLDRIFDPFFTTREVGQGTGLGLSVCHGITAEHGGKIYVQSKLGKGATFIVELPIVTKPEQMELPEPDVEEPQKVTKAKILVVDDEPVVLSLLSQLLTDEGHEVETVDNADDALERIKSKRYRLILLDVKMPGMSGIELYSSIQNIARALAKRVVFITGDVIGATTMDFLSKTKAPYITKPFDAEQLKKDIDRLLTEGA